jgi:RND family efflux transporter MFP subunit
VGEKYVENYEDVRAKQNILSLHDITTMEIVVDVPENIMAVVEDSHIVKIIATFDAAPEEEFPIEIKEAAAQADPRTRTYRVTMTMPQPEELRVLPGMTAQVTGYFKPGDGTESSSFVVPAAAVFAGDDGKHYLWVVDPASHTVNRRKVNAGEVTGTGDIIIQDGLKAGERIAVAAVSLLREDTKIRIVDE